MYPVGEFWLATPVTVARHMFFKARLCALPVTVTFMPRRMRRNAWLPGEEKHGDSSRFYVLIGFGCLVQQKQNDFILTDLVF